MAKTLKTESKHRGLKPFKPGQSGNPGGRPKGLAESVRKHVPPSKLVDLHKLIALAPSMDVKKELGEAPTIKDRQASADWLADRGWGKALQQADVGGTVILKWKLPL